MNFDSFVGGAYLSRSPSFDAQRLVNLYLETGSGASKATAMLLGTPGLRRFTTLPGPGGIRGLWTASRSLYASPGGRAFAVCGPTLYEVFANGTYAERGTLASTSGPVSMADNGVELVVVDGTDKGSLLTLATNAFAPITASGFAGASRVAFVDGYFVLNRPGTQQFYVSGLYAGGTYDATDFASAESVPDNLLALEVERREMLLLGSRSGEVWFNSGAADFPFAPIQGTAFPYGIAAVHSLRALGQFYWLSGGPLESGGPQVMRLKGYAPERISTHALEHALQGYSRVDDAIGFSYQEEGHTFYGLSFPTGNATWVYDLATGLWHERADLDTTTGQLKRHRVQHHAYAFHKHLVGGEDDGRIYESSLDVFDNDGDPLVRERTSPYLHHDRRLLYHAVFEVDMQVGVGLDSGANPGTNPQVMMQFSDDGGRTWSQEKWVSAGAQGQYHTRAIWRRLGRSRQRTYRVRISDPVRVALIAARIEVS
jgi:hypothetical protein